MEVDDLQVGQISPYVNGLVYTYIVFLRQHSMRGRGNLWCHIDVGSKRE
jgi:hypothetical protein